MRPPEPYRGHVVAGSGSGPDALVFYDEERQGYAYLGPEGWAFWHYRALTPEEALREVRRMLALAKGVAFVEEEALKRLEAAAAGPAAA